MTDPPPERTPTTVDGALEHLATVVEERGATAEVFDDGSAMTPMLVVTFDGCGNRAEVMRPLFHADGPVAVDSVHSHKVVVREA